MLDGLGPRGAAPYRAGEVLSVRSPTLPSPAKAGRDWRGRGEHMFGKLNHLAITSDHYTLLGMFYRAVFGIAGVGRHRAPDRRHLGRRRLCRDDADPAPRRAQGGTRSLPASRSRYLHQVRDKIAPAHILDIEIVQLPQPAVRELQRARPGRQRFRPVAARARTAPRSTPPIGWRQENQASAISPSRAREAERLASFYADVFELEARNIPRAETAAGDLTDGQGDT